MPVGGFRYVFGVSIIALGKDALYKLFYNYYGNPFPPRCSLLIWYALRSTALSLEPLHYRHLLDIGTKVDPSPIFMPMPFWPLYPLLFSPRLGVHKQSDPGFPGLSEKLKEGEGRQQSLRRYRRADGELSACKRKYSVFEISIKRKISYNIQWTWPNGRAWLKCSFNIITLLILYLK